MSRKHRSYHKTYSTLPNHIQEKLMYLLPLNTIIVHVSIYFTHWWKWKVCVYFTDFHYVEWEIYVDISVIELESDVHHCISIYALNFPFYILFIFNLQLNVPCSSCINCNIQFENWKSNLCHSTFSVSEDYLWFFGRHIALIDYYLAIIHESIWT